MSSGAGGEVIGLVVVGAAAGAVVVAAGLVVGVGYCAVGVARGAAAAGRAANEAWEAHEQARALEARALELEGARWADYLTAEQAFMSACAEAGLDPTSLVPGPYPDPSSEVAAIQQAIGLMSATTGRLNRELAARAAVSRSRALAVALSHESATSAVAADDALRSASDVMQRAHAESEAARQAAVAESVADAVERLREAQDATLGRRITRALSELPDDADARTAEQVQAWLRRVGDLSGDQLAEAASALETLCGAAASDSALRALRDERAGAVIAALSGCRTPRAVELSDQARAYLAGERPWDPHLLDRVKEELSLIQREFDDLWAAVVLAGTLADLGYELGPAFVADAISEEGAYAGHPDWPDHLVHVEYDLDTREVDFDIIRVGDPGRGSSRAQQLEDVEVEREFCTDFDTLLQAAQAKGVVIRIDERIEPGVEPVDRVDVSTDRRRTTRSKRRKGQKAKERQMRSGGRDG